MRTFIQLRDGIGYATIITPADAPDHTVTPDHTNAIEVFTDNPDQFLKMKYNAETKSWSEAPVLRYAEINAQGEIIEIKRTVFEHEVDDDTKLMEADTTHLHKWIDGEWVKEEPIVQEINQDELEAARLAQNALIAEMRVKWEADPMSVDASWRAHFNI
jgi:hypothetical protein